MILYYIGQYKLDLFFALSRWTIQHIHRYSMVRHPKCWHTLISASLLYSSLNFVCIYSCIQTLNACTKHIFIFSSVIMYIIKESHQSNYLKILNSLICCTQTLYIFRLIPGVKDANIQLFIPSFTSKKFLEKNLWRMF